MTPVEASSVVRFGRRSNADWASQRRYIAAGLVLAQEVDRLEAAARDFDRLEGECDELRAELQRVQAELEEQYEAVHEMNETFAEALVALQQAMGTP
jgi:chromosome segregation ATPase